MQLSVLAIISIVSVLIVAGLYFVPKWQVRDFSDPVDKWKCENEARRTLAQVFGGAALIATWTFTWIQIRETEAHNRQSEEHERETKVLEDAKFRNEQFAKAVEKVANQEVEVRIGGIYALGQLAHRSRDDYWPIVELLSSYIVNRSQPRKRTGTDGADVQAALRVVAWRDWECDPDPDGYQKLDMGFANLSYFDLTNAYLVKADLRATNLEGAFMEGANLRGALAGKRGTRTTTLAYADLQWADLRDIDFGTSDLTWPNVNGANVTGTEPPAIRERLKLMGAVEGLDEEKWLHSREDAGFKRQSPRLFGGAIDCKADSERAAPAGVSAAQRQR